MPLSPEAERILRSFHRGIITGRACYFGLLELGLAPEVIADLMK